MSMGLKELREKRNALAQEAEAILTGAAEEGRAMTAEEESKFDSIHEDVDSLGRSITRAEKQHDLNTDLDGRDTGSVGREDTSFDADGEDRSEKITSEDRSNALRAWMLQGTDHDPSERQLEAAKKVGMRLNGSLNFDLENRAPTNLKEYRAQSVGTDSAGGYTVPTGFVSEIETALLAYGGMREAAKVIRTSDGRDLPFITVNDTSNTGALLGENAAVSNQDVTFGQTILGAFKYSSKQVLVSVELLQDESVDLESYLGGLLGERIGRIVNTHMTTGTGSSQPNGIVTASTDSGISAGSATAVTYAELVDLVHSVDPAYRTGAKFMMNDSTVKALKKLVDGDSRPLWNSGMTVGEPDTILGHKYIVNQDVATMASDAKSILFGDFSKYIIRDVLGIQLLRLNERYADNHQVAFLAYSRHDGDLLDAGTNPVKYFQNAT